MEEEGRDGEKWVVSMTARATPAAAKEATAGKTESANVSGRLQSNRHQLQVGSHLRDITDLNHASSNAMWAA